MAIVAVRTDSSSIASRAWARVEAVPALEEEAPATVGAEIAGLRGAAGGLAAIAGRRSRRGWFVRRMLLGADLLGLLVAFAATELAFSGNSGFDHVGVGRETAIFVALLPVWVFTAKLYGLYDRDDERIAHATADEIVDVFHLVTVGVWAFFALSWLPGLSSPGRPKLAAFWLFAMVAVISTRSLARAIARRQPAYFQKALIVGAGNVGQLIGRKLLQHPEYGINLIGFVDAEPRERRGDLGGLQLLGTPDELSEIVRRHGIDRVVVAFSRDGHERMLDLVRSLRQHDVQIDLVPRLFDAVNPKVGIHAVEGLPLIGLPASRIPRSSRFLKRCFDVAGASVLLLLTSPLLGLIALLVKRGSPGAVFFRQTRVGMGRREFTLLKFRTMYDGTEHGPHREYISQIMSPSALPTSSNLYKLDRSDAVTRVGRLLRKTSLDELPQLINVMRGDMSLVGPRPCLPYELEFFAPHHFERFLVPPGVTGLWQVEARAHSTFAEALDFDVAYSHGWSFGLDLRLLLRTPRLMLRKRETG